MLGKIDETKFSREIVARKRRNRKILLYTVVLSVLMSFFYKNYLKLEVLKYEQSVSMNKEMIVVNNSFLARNGNFYSDEQYLKQHDRLNKEWEREQGGIKFYGKSEGARQEHYTISAHETSESGVSYRGESR